MEAANLSRRGLVRLYYFFQFSFNMLFWAPVFFEYQKRVGLSESEIFGIQSVYYLAFCLLEIPTGYFADRFGYLTSMRLGAAALIASHALAIFAPNYGGILVHFLLVALARSLISGASSAYLYEFLRGRSLESEFKAIEGKARAYSLFGKVACFAAIGPLMEWRLSLPYWLSLGTSALALLFALRLPRVSVHGVPSPGAFGFRPSVGSALRLALASPWLLFLMVQGVAVFVLGRIIAVNLFQPILAGQGFRLASYGAVMALMTVFEAAGSYRPDWVRRFGTDVNSVFALTVVVGISIALIPDGGRAMTLVRLCVFSLAVGFIYPIQRQLMNDAIPDGRYRATILSIESIVDRAVCAYVAWSLEQAVARPQDGELGPVPVFLLLSGVLTVALMLVMWAGSRYFVPKLKGQEGEVGPSGKAYS